MGVVYEPIWFVCQGGLGFLLWRRRFHSLGEVIARGDSDPIHGHASQPLHWRGLGLGLLHWRSGASGRHGFVNHHSGSGCQLPC